MAHSTGLYAEAHQGLLQVARERAVSQGIKASLAYSESLRVSLCNIILVDDVDDDAANSPGWLIMYNIIFLGAAVEYRCAYIAHALMNTGTYIVWDNPIWVDYNRAFINNKDYEEE